MIVPQSQVNASNYHLLGNQAVGETRRSRMKRVNNVKAHTPSLINQQPGQMVNIKGAKPLGLTLEEGTGEMVRDSLVAGALAFLGNTAYRHYIKGGSKIKWTDARNGAAVSTALAMAPTIIKSYLDTFNKEKGFFGQLDPVTAATVLALGPAVGYFTAGEDKLKKKLPEMRTATLAVTPIAVPALYGGWEGVAKTLPAYFAAIVGLYFSSKFVPAVRGK